MAPESPPPSSDDVKRAPQASELPQAHAAEGQASTEPTKEISPKSVFVNSEPIREDQVQNAVKFLSHPRVRGSPVIHRRNFLERKGLTKEEIDEAFRRVPDPSSGVTNAQTTTSQDGQMRTSSNVQQQGSAQILQAAGGAPSGVMSAWSRQFRWYHAFLAIGFFAVSGAGTVIVFKNSIVPRLRSWIRKVVSDDDYDGLKKNGSKPVLNEEATEAAKAAAAAAADAAKASQEMVVMKSEETKHFEQFMNLLDVQLQEIKSMKTAIWKLQGQNQNTGRAQRIEEEYLSGSTSYPRQSMIDGKADYDSRSSRSARSSSPPVSSEPHHPKSYVEIMAMVQRGERPPNIRDIIDAPPNPNQPISNPNLASRTMPWDTVQPARTTSYGSQPPYTSEGSSSMMQDNSISRQINNETPTTWWQQKNVRITEIGNEDDHQITRSNSNIPINQPPQRKWAPPQPPPVAMPEAAIAIQQPKSAAPKDKTLNSTSSHGNDMDELQRVTKISESGGELEMNGGAANIVSSSEILEEQAAS